MARRHVLSAVLVALALPALAALPATAAAAPIDETLTIETTVPGVQLNAHVLRPDGPAKVPILLTFTPYGTLAEPNPADDGLAGEYLDKGYARVVADVPGTRGSTGCWDYGGKLEQQAGVDLVAALAKLPWSNGRVAMIGVSYEGTTASMVAARGAVPGLAAIVPESAISRWYGYAYQDGVRYALNTENPTDEGFDTPVGFDFGFALTLGTDPARPQFAQTVIDHANPCDRVAHTQKGYSRDPDYDAFWMERDYLKDAAAFRVPVFVVHGWQDENVRQSEGLDLFERLPVDDPATPATEGVPFKRLYMFQGVHESASGEQFAPLLEAFLEHTLKGVANGVDQGPEAISFTTDGDQTAEQGDVFPSWPPPRTGDVTLRLGRADGAGVLAATASGTGDSLTDLATTAEDVVAQDPTAERTWLTYATAPLADDVRIAGSPYVDLVATVSGTRAQLAPVLLDVAPDDSVTVITRGFMDLRYRDDLQRRVDIPQGSDLRAAVRLAPQDQTVRKGHRIALVVAGSNVPWALPEAPGTGFALRFGPAGTALRLPVVGAGTDKPAIVRPLPALPGATAGLKPRRGALTVAVRRVSRRSVRVSGRAPRGARVTVRLRRGDRVVASRRVRASSAGRFRVVFRVAARRGRLRASALVTVRGRTLTARSR